MRTLLFLPVFFFYSSSAGTAAPTAPPACLPLPAVQSEPDGWLLLAGLVVCMAGRLAARRN
ncbi:hypothetical protein [Massilia varians]|uniref:hypothetical protein n=1 Tax=Massilia varians TaxID=457921 RepID=UPI002556BE7B|nr:hypothetical protein [Massilia varians]MDK6079146.1 hypothetical protein [Massilia varians]